MRNGGTIFIGETAHSVREWIGEKWRELEDGTRLSVLYELKHGSSVNNIDLKLLATHKVLRTLRLQRPQT